MNLREQLELVCDTAYVRWVEIDEKGYQELKEIEFWVNDDISEVFSEGFLEVSVDYVTVVDNELIIMLKGANL